MSSDDSLICIADQTDEGWSCTATTWSDVDLMVQALHRSGPFLALVSFVDGALEWVAEERWLISDGDKIAVRSYEPSSARYDFFGRSNPGAPSRLTVVEANPALADEPAAVEVPEGLMLEPSEAILVLEQVMTGIADVPSTRLL